MWRLIGAGLGLCFLGCGATTEFSSRRLDDGSYQLQCLTSLARCLDRVDEVCRGSPYDVVNAQDHRRTVDVEVASSKTELRSSEAIVRCTSNKPLFGGSGDRPAASPPEAEPPRACIPGATQRCVGLGACSGGQACLGDGSGFGPCQCGAPPRPSSDGGAAGAGA